MSSSSLVALILVFSNVVYVDPNADVFRFEDFYTSFCEHQGSDGAFKVQITWQISRSAAPLLARGASVGSD